MNTKIIRHIIFVLILTFFVGISRVNAQQVPLYNQYMMNKFLLNPAVAGSEGYTSFSLVSHLQWIGFGESPMTNALVGQMRLCKNSFVSNSASVKRKRRISKRSGKVGLGGYIYNDQSGINDITGMQMSYAYHINLRSSQVSFGLSLNAYQYALKGLNLYENDKWASSTRLSMLIPDANSGVYFSNSKFYAGFSVDQLLQSILQFGEPSGLDLTMYRNYYLLGGYFYEIDRTMLLETSTLMKMTNQAQAQIELGSKLYYQEHYWGGFAWRTGGNWGSVIFMGGVKIDKVFLGYSFDWPLNALGRHTFGTHELSASIKLGSGAKRYSWMNRY